MNAHRPILIHRAVLGSLERFWALWMEECRGRWPFWASPRQCRVVPVVADVHSTEGKAVLAYAQEVAVELRGDQRDHTEAYRVTLDGDHDETLAKRVRAAQLLQYNFVAVIGEREYRTKTVSVRDRDTNRSEVVHVRDLLKRWHDLQRVCFASDLRG